MTLNFAPYRVAFFSALLFGSAALVGGCARNADALTPQQLQQQYGITNAYAGQVTTPDGAIAGTLGTTRMTRVSIRWHCRAM